MHLLKSKEKEDQGEKEESKKSARKQICFAEDNVWSWLWAVESRVFIIYPSYSFFNNIIYGLHSMIDSLILCLDGKLLSLLRPSRVPLFAFIYIIVLGPSKFLNECCSENFKSTICPAFWFPRSQVGLPAGCFHLIFIHGNKQWTKTPC